MRKIRKIEPAAPLLVQKKKVAAYARVSMESERLMHSLSAQVSFYSSLIQGNPEWEYAGVYVDSGVSGTSMAGRTEFRRLLADCEAGCVNIILGTLGRMSLTSGSMCGCRTAVLSPSAGSAGAMPHGMRNSRCSR